ncbi:DUF1775 domain-containing protein [Blastococcus sp. KM273129]|nr:DUF1775 domain-containing protein [Blastococcus sp. KM273129]
MRSGWHLRRAPASKRRLASSPGQGLVQGADQGISAQLRVVRQTDGAPPCGDRRHFRGAPGTAGAVRATTGPPHGSGSLPRRRSTKEPAVPVRPLRALVASSLATVVVLAGAGAASAHVRVTSSDAAPGGFGELTFRVPNESDTASTVSLRVQIPAETPLASVSVKPVPGWTATTSTGPVDPPVEVHGSEVTEAVTEITWVADPGAGIAPGQYQTFSISAGPIPEVDEISFPAIQTYDDGVEQAWIEPTVEGQDEPESPAPVLSLTGGSDAAHGSAPAADAPAEADGTATGAASDATAADATAADGSGLAVAALVVGGLGLVVGAAALALALASRRRSS